MTAFYGVAGAAVTDIIVMVVLAVLMVCSLRPTRKAQRVRIRSRK